MNDNTTLRLNPKVAELTDLFESWGMSLEEAFEILQKVWDQIPKKYRMME